MKANLIIPVLKNHIRDYIKVNSRLNFDEIQQLCFKNYNWEINKSSDKISSDTLLIYPRLICTKPFSLIYTPLDDYYHSLRRANRVILYITSDITCVESLSDLFVAVNRAYGKEIRVGVKTFSLSGELMINNDKEYRVIFENSSNDDTNRKVHHLI